MATSEMPCWPFTFLPEDVAPFIGRGTHTDDPSVLLAEEAGRVGRDAVRRSCRRKKGPPPCRKTRSETSRIAGLFHLGIDQANFRDRRQRQTFIIHCLQSLTPGQWQLGASGLGLPYHPFGPMHFRHACLSPIVFHSKAIGRCFAGRLQDNAFNERRCAWIQQIVHHIAAAFSTTRD